MNLRKNLSRMTFGAIVLAASIGFAAGTSGGSAASQGSGTSSSQGMSGSQSGAQSAGSQVAGGTQASSMSYEVIEFSKGSADLNENSKAAIQALVDKARASGDVKRIHIAAWSDQAFPKGKTELSRAEKDLATKRIDVIENYVKKDLKISNVDNHNMAKKTGWLARAFNTEDAELKSLFAQRGAPVTNVEFQTLKSAGGPSKALVWPEMALKK